jgi:hypothetical protein
MNLLQDLLISFALLSLIAYGIYWMLDIDKLKN